MEMPFLSFFMQRLEARPDTNMKWAELQFPLRQTARRKSAGLAPSLAG